MDGDTIFIPSFDEDIFTKKTRLEEIIIGLVVFVPIKMPENGHCVIHCFSKRFNESIEQVLERLWEEIISRIDVYMQFGE